QGQVPEGLQFCERGFAKIAQLQDGTLLVDAQLAMVQAYVRAGNASKARATLAALEKSFDQHPETKWVALAWMARLDPALLGSARTALDDLRRSWGEDAWPAYSKRPDRQKLVMSLSDGNMR